MTYTFTGVAALLVHASKRGRFGLDATIDITVEGLETEHVSH